MKTRALTLLLFALTFIGQSVFAQEADTTIVSKNESSSENAPMIDYRSPRSYIINQVEIKGIKYAVPDYLVASSGLSRGMTIFIPGEDISAAVTRLWNQRLFSDVKVVAEIVGDSVNLEIYLKERPRVSQWKFDGVRKGEASTLLEDLELRRGTEYSDHVMTKNCYLISKHFIDKGFRNVEVTPTIENDTLMENRVIVTFVVDKKQRVKIGEINFEGNQVFPDSRLRRTMKKTHQKSINFFQSSKFKSDEYETDKNNIIDFYNSKGYRNAMVVRDSIYAISDNRIGIDIELAEGDKFYIRDVEWVGNSKYPTDYLNMILGIKKGDVYDSKTIKKRLGIGSEENPEDMTQVKSMYQNDGYLTSNVTPTEIVVGKDSIDLEIKIFEGKQYTINNVNISGNLRVDDEVIRRELYTRPGELYNRALIMQTMRQLSQMQHFDAQALMPEIRDLPNENLVDISWPLTEVASDRFEISGGWGAGMFVGSVGVQLNNLSIKNFFKKGQWRPYPQGQNQQLTIRAQTNGSYYKTFMLGFTEPWLGGKKPNSLTISAHYSEQTDAYYFGGIVRQATSYFRTNGVAVGIGRRLTWPDPNFTIYNEIGYQSYKLKNWAGYFKFSDGRSNILTFRTVFARNTVNQPIYPSSGSEFSLSLTLTPPYSLFDGKDYKNMSNTDIRLYKWIEYHKWNAKAQWYFPLTKNNKLVLMTKAEMGYLGYYNRYKQSPFEGYDVGGDGMSGYNIYGVDIIGLRGYEDSSLTPYDATGTTYANAYNKYTVELRYPVIMQPQSQIYGLVFAEGGNAFRSWQEFDPFKLKRSLGVGVRLYLPVVGMIGVDWGYGFDRAVNATKKSGGHFHFMMGMDF